jgi:hypothetical protein
MTRVNGGGRAFRQHNQPKQLPIDESTQLPPPSNGLAQHYVAQGETHLSINVQLITPEMARTWLDRGGANRKLSERRVMQLVAAIQMGEWQLTGEPIQLDADGRVRNGQHRLEAIFRANVAVQALVVRNVSEAAFDVIDTGRSRSAGDVLAIHGHTSVVAKATAARGLILLERFERFDVGAVKVGYKAAPTNAQILAYVEAHPEIVEAVSLADRLRLTGGFVGGSGLWAIALTLFLRINPEQTKVFVDSLVEGANLESGSPILRLRNMYAVNVRDWSGTSDNRERLLAVTIKGWNAWRRDELVQALSWHSAGRGAEKFPVAE